MIVVYGASRRYTSEELADAAIGVTDDRGNPFTIITLDWNPKLKNNHLSKTRGFEDAVITRDDNGLSVTYRLPGSAVWMLNDLSRRYSAKIPYTKHNMAVLGSHFEEGLWTIREQRFKDAAQVIWERIKGSMSSEELGENVKRMKGHFISMFDSPEDAPDLRKFIEESENDPVNIMNQKSELAKKQVEIDEQQRKLNQTIEWINRKTLELERSGITLAAHSLESLEQMTIQDLRKTAKASGVKWSPSMKKDDLIPIILKAQYTPKIGSASVDLKKNEEKKDEPETVTE